MTTFEITQDDRNFSLSFDGKVRENGEELGVWTTKNDGSIVIVAAGDVSPPFDSEAGPEPTATVPVVWQFNDKNQLTVHTTDGEELVNVNKVEGALPFFRTRDAVLFVRPDLGHVFEFQLQPEWGLDENHDLTFTLGGTTSVIDGAVQDQRSRFMYHFVDKENIAINSVLGFVGSWSTSVDQDSGDATLTFTYRQEGRKDGIFALPAALTIDRGTTQFLYEYDKDDQTYRIQLVGFLQVNEKFEITYALDRQEARDGTEQVAQTTFAFQTRYVGERFTSTLTLQLMKDDGTEGSTLTIGGHMSAVLGEKKLQVGFAFEQKREGQTVTSTFAFNGSLELKNTTVTWTFESDAKQTSIEIAASDFKVGSARADARLNLRSQDGKLVGVKLLFGVSF